MMLGKCMLLADSSLWSNPKLAVSVAAAAFALLLATIWLLRRRKRDGRGAAMICLLLSVGLHGLLLYFLPAFQAMGLGGASSRGGTEPSHSLVTITDFEPDAATGSQSSEAVNQADEPSPVAPLPVSFPNTAELAPKSQVDEVEPTDAPEIQPEVKADPAEPVAPPALPASLATTAEIPMADSAALAEELLSQWLSDDAEVPANPSEPNPSVAADAGSGPVHVSDAGSMPAGNAATGSSESPAHIPGTVDRDFAQRAGDDKLTALFGTGGDQATEAAVQAALRFLAADQRPDGSWDPLTSGAGRETLTLGTDRKSAGRNSTTGITGLALLSMLGAGNTHLQGTYADQVRRGLIFLIQHQHPDGSLAGDAKLYEANYCHGMAALAMCEAAALTGDASALRSAEAAVRYTLAMQHPTTGGWRYMKGEVGDLSQLGWQVMVLDAGQRAGVRVPAFAFQSASKFMDSVRAGTHGGLASYRPGEAPSRTMTAEALATRLLMNEKLPAAAIQEAEEYILRQLPGIGRDNYYGWYYTALALHQLQDDAWQRWNEAMKSRLLARQESNGSWPTDDEWGGYGGRIYSTATAALCLEVYYRHAIRNPQVAQGQPSDAPEQR